MCMTAVYVILIIAAVIALIALIPIDAAFTASYLDNSTDIILGITYSFLKIPIIPAPKKKPKKKKPKKPEKEEDTKKEKKEKPKKPLKLQIKIAKDIADECLGDAVNLVKHLFTHTLQTKLFKLQATFGTGNPMYTGIAYGTASAAIYNLVGFIDNHSKLYEWSVDLKPDFEKAVVEGRADVTIRTRIAYIIKLALMAGVLILKVIMINRRVTNNATK